jgi:hypothetical protein
MIQRRNRNTVTQTWRIKQVSMSYEQKPKERERFWDFVGDTHPDVDIGSPELDCNACSGKLEGQNSEPSNCIIPSNSETPFSLMSARERRHEIFNVQ